MQRASAVKNPSIFLTLAAIVFFGGAILLFAVTPLLRKIGSAQAAIRASRVELLAVEQKIESYNTAITELAKIQANKEDILRIFPKREAMVNLVQGIESAVTRAGAIPELKITDKKEDPLAADIDRGASPVVPGLKDIEEVPYSLTLSGHYRSLTDFLLFIEHQPFVTEFKKFAITAVTVQDETSKALRNTGLASGIFEGVFFIARSP